VAEDFDSLSPKATAPSGESTDDIKREIARTRVEMSETLGEIQDRLRPDHLLQQARDGVTQAAAGKVRTMMQSAGETAGTVAIRARETGDFLADYARTHPIQVAFTVGALAWWMLRGRDRSTWSDNAEWYGARDTQWDDDLDPMSYPEGHSLRERVGEYAATARETVGEYAATARDKVSDLASNAREAAGEYAQSARQGAVRASTRVRSAAGTATTSMDQWVHDNPLAAGAVALAVGAAIGLSVPRTELEDSAMGETRDRAWQKAAQVASNLRDNVTDKVATAAENLVGESVARAASTPPSSMGRA
jgi:ElaB/YqjD/DUF883 family membrane-anchored ribosome-binding protein